MIIQEVIDMQATGQPVIVDNIAIFELTPLSTIGACSRKDAELRTKYGNAAGFNYNGQYYMYGYKKN